MVLSQFYAYLVFIGSFIEPPEGLNYFFSWQNLLGSRVPRVPLGRTVNVENLCVHGPCSRTPRLAFTLHTLRNKYQQTPTPRPNVSQHLHLDVPAPSSHHMNTTTL